MNQAKTVHKNDVSADTENLEAWKCSWLDKHFWFLKVNNLFYSRSTIVWRSKGAPRIYKVWEKRRWSQEETKSLTSAKEGIHRAFELGGCLLPFKIRFCEDLTWNSGRAADTYSTFGLEKNEKDFWRIIMWATSWR